MKVGLVLKELHQSETALYYQLLQLSQRHIAEHEVHHVSRDIAQWSREHVAKIADTATSYGEKLEPVIADRRASKHASVEHHDAALGQHNPSGLPLLWDLQGMYMTTSGISAQWLMLSQAAQALQKSDLLTLVGDCKPRTQQQMRWANAQIKQLSAQILVS
ncbi:MAG: hypothetical protein L0L76_11530 [Yaniella sp.]|uniref:hypothetical protein n=1 Tax=Yaniella sp. TaxID=2773929 RepID=UPI0026471345|nr:hypothetical protein [Yaniella sp.]MDN6759218.1 hypothetical protein [Yaniella sp.]